MQLEKPRVFNDTKSFVWVLLGLSSIIILRLALSYQEYRSFIQKPFYYTYAEVISEKVKTSHEKSYRVLKLHSDNGLQFITTSYTKNSYANRRLRLQIFPDERISFRGYLGTFFVKSRIKEVLSKEKSLKERLLEKVNAQHPSEHLASFYHAIFFAEPLPAKLRDQIGKLGVSHLVALSGFHLGILWGIVYGFLSLLYRPLQQRYFPYRFVLIDVGVVTLSVLALYLWFVGAPPSLVRSYAMLLVGWGVLLLGMELLSFRFLWIVVGIVLLLIPSLVVSLGFWFSVAGVFSIFLLLKYTKNSSRYMLSLAVIPLGVFLLMLPIVHTVFPVTTPYQLLSPLLSLLFVPFYPLVIVLHLVGYGGVLDEVLFQLFQFPSDTEVYLLSTEMMVAYILLAFLSIKYRYAFLLLVSAALTYAGYLFL
ncbi:MAG: ComEC/Rec2 family competence protein [Sulfurimonas sp.]